MSYKTSNNLVLHVCNFVPEFDHRLISIVKYKDANHEMQEKLLKVCNYIMVIILGDEIRYINSSTRRGRSSVNVENKYLL